MATKIKLIFTGGSINQMLKDKNIDGIDHWNALLTNKSSPRNEMLYNIDPGLETNMLHLKRDLDN